MCDAKPTEGLWEHATYNVPLGDTGDYDGVDEVKAANGRLIVSVWNGDDEDVANLRRIAASPDFEALAERVVEIFAPMQAKGQNGHTFELLLERAQKALAKARPATHSVIGGSIAPDSALAELDEAVKAQTVGGGGV